MDEANVETHGFEPSFTKKNAHPACWPEWHDAIVDRGVRMVSSLFPLLLLLLVETTMQLLLSLLTISMLS